MAIYSKKTSLNDRCLRSLPARFHTGYFLCRLKMNPVFQEIFFYPGSMTDRLNQFNKNNVTLTLIQHAWQTAQLGESRALSIGSEWGIGREVVMHCSGKPWLYARSFFPEVVVKSSGHDFAALGERPLGEILFSDPQCFRSSFQVACLFPGHSEYQVAANSFSDAPDYFWARRSVFHMPSGTVTLLEVFSSFMEAAFVRK